jgi:polyisoprenoid-binding protein YceI
MHLNRTTTARPGRVAFAATLCTLLAACPRPARQPAEPTPSPVPFEIDEPLPPDARRFRVVPDASLLTILVYRAGALAKSGHNHVIASRALSGAVVFTPEVKGSAFALRMPVESLTVDEPELRQASGEEFAAEIPQSARKGTRDNMLSAAVLDAGRFPDVTMRSRNIEPAVGGALATVQVTVRDRSQVFSVPLRYEQKGEELLADGELVLRQTDLGLKPFSALLGALQVQDELRVRFRILARAT